MEILRTPVHSSAAWHGRDERHNQDWVYQLTGDDVADLDAALAQATHGGSDADHPMRVS